MRQTTVDWCMGHTTGVYLSIKGKLTALVLELETTFGMNFFHMDNCALQKSLKILFKP